MAGITLAMAQASLEAAIAAHDKILSANQAYSVSAGGTARNMQRAALADALKSVQYWDTQVKLLSARASGRGRAYTVVST